MINGVELKNFGPIEQLDWQNLGKINLVIGNNGCGKSFLLKALYSAMKTIEEYKREDNPESDADILWRKLYWIFQVEKIGDLVTDRDTEFLSFKLEFDDKEFSYVFFKETLRLVEIVNKTAPRFDNSIYLPAKEVLSLFHIIFASRENKKEFGFDETYFDLVKALLAYNSQLSNLYESLNRIIKLKKEINDQEEILLPKFKDILYRKEKLTSFQLEELKKDVSFDSNLEKIEEILNNVSKNKSDINVLEKITSEKIEKEEKLKNIFQECKSQLNNMIGGKLEYNQDKNRWYFKRGERYFPMGVTAEGIKKIGVLDTLFNNGYLTENSIIFIDELEANLHPTAISNLLDIIGILAKDCGIQFFIASHSYFVIKKLFLIAQEQQMSIPVLSYQNNEWVQSDLKDDLPDNPIVDESIRLYEEQLDLAGV